MSGPKLTFLIRWVLDEWVPPIVRDSRWFFAPVMRFYNRKLDLDFKVKAPAMTEHEFCEAYERIMPMRESDVTSKVRQFVLSHLVGTSVLEVGCGNGTMALECAKRGFQVTATDLAESNVLRIREKSTDVQAEVANAECLPFADAVFDTVICLHTLEHVRGLARAAAELQRVTRRRLIVVVPRERYYRYSGNYNLNFFGGAEQLGLLFGHSKYESRVLDGAICYAANTQVPSAQ